MSDVALQVAAARLAVLPFESLSDDAADAYFARGFVEDLIVELSRFPALEVLHPDSAFAAADGARRRSKRTARRSPCAAACAGAATSCA